MNGWNIDSKKRAEWWPLVQELAWCLPLPFLMELKIGFDFYILGPAYYLAVMRDKRRRLPAALLAAAGIALLPTGALRWKYGLVLLLFTAQEWIIDRKAPLLPFWKRCFFYVGGLAAASVALSLTSVLAAYQLVTVFLEAILLMGAACLYDKTLSPQRSSDELRMAGTSLAMGTFLAAFHWIHLDSLIPAEVVLLALGLAGGYELGLARGLVITLPAALFMRISLTAGEGLLMLTVICLALSSAFRDMGKRASITAGFAGGSLWVLLFMGGSNVIPGVLTVGSAGLLFGLVPQKAAEKIRKGSREGREEFQYKSQWQRYLEGKLSQGAEAFQRIADLICIPSRQLKITSQDLVYLKEDIAGSLCQDCEKQRVCWGRQYAKTHETVVRVMEASRQKGRVERKDLPEAFLKTCQRPTDFVRTVNRHYELYRLNQSWENRMAQSAQLLQGQYEAMAVYLRSMRDHFMGELEAEEEVKQRIWQHLQRQGVVVKGVWVLADERENRVKIHVDFGKNLTGREEKQYEKVLTELTGRPMVLQEKLTLPNGLHRCRFADPNRYRFQLGEAAMAADRVSGDCYTAQRLDEYRFVLALGDGMGSGEEAREESGRALALLEQLLLTGVDEEKAIGLLNTALVLSSQEEIFTTIDLALLNLHSGQLKLVKAGSCTTFLRSRAAVHVYHSHSLPVGILEEPEPETYSHQMENGDMLVMISDGVLDQLPDPKRGEKWIRRYLMQTEEENPQALAEHLQQELLPHLPRVRDDQTILAVRIEKLPD